VTHANAGEMAILTSTTAGLAARETWVNGMAATAPTGPYKSRLRVSMTAVAITVVGRTVRARPTREREDGNILVEFLRRRAHHLLARILLYRPDGQPRSWS
jgi:hypothetical protein